MAGGAAAPADSATPAALIIAALAALAWIALSPFALSAAVAEVDRRALIWALAGLMLLQPWWPWRALRRCGGLLAAALACWWLAEALSLLHALHPLASAFGGPERGLGLLDHAAWWLCLLAVLGRLRQAPPAHAEWLQAGLLGIGAVLAVMLLGEWLLLRASGQAARAAGAPGNPAFSASLLAPLLVLALARPSAPGQRTGRRLQLCATLLLGLALLATGSRGGLLAVVAGCSLVWLSRSRWSRGRLQDRPPRDGFWLRPWPRHAVLLAGLLALAGLLWWGWQARPASVQIRAELYAAAWSAPLAAQPLQRWQGGADPQHSWRPWLGFGRDSQEPALTRLRPAAMNALEADGHDRLADRSHSLWLDRWLEGGAVGLLVWAGLAVALVRRLRRSADTQALSQTWLRSLPATAALLTALVDRSLSVPSAGADLLLALLLALSLLPWCRRIDAAGCANQTGTQSSPITPEPQHEPGRMDTAPSPLPSRWRALHRARRWLPVLMTLPALPLLASALAELHHGLWRAEWSPAHPRHAASAAADELAARCSDGAASAIALARQPYSALPLLRLDELALERCLAGAGPDGSDFLLRAAPSLPRAWLAASAQALRAGDHAGARAALRQALLLIDDPATLSATATGLLWAAIAAQEGDPVTRRQDARTALDALAATPAALRDAVWWRTSAWLQATLGDIPAAIAAYRQALQLNPADLASARNLQRLLEQAPP